MRKFSDDAKKLFYLVHGQDNSRRKAWYYIMVRPELLAVFRLKLATKNLVITDYGTVLASGYGDQPPAAMTVFENYMQKKA